MKADANSTHKGSRMWPSLESATWWFDAASIVFWGSLIVGVIATGIILKTGQAKEQFWAAARDAANERIVATEQETARVKAESNERIAALTTQGDEARAEIAKANARAAEADLKAAEANLKAEALRAQMMPRRMNGEAFKKALVGQPSAPVEVMFDVDVPDARLFALELWGDLLDNSWPASRPMRIPDDPQPQPDIAGFTDMLPKHSILGMEAWGISVLTNPADKALEKARDALNDALSGMTSEPTSKGTNEFVPAGKIRVLVGPRAM